MAPEYMKDVQGFDLLGSGALASLPFIINLIVVFIACIGLDFLLHRVRDSWTKIGPETILRIRIAETLHVAVLISLLKAIMTKQNYEKFGICLHLFQQ